MKQHNLTDRQIDLIINAAYDDASFIEKIEVYFLLRKSAEAKELFDEYRKTSSSVKNVKPIELPFNIEEKVKNKIGIKEENDRSFLIDLYSLVLMKPIVSGLTVVLLVATLTTSLLLNRNKQIEYNNYSEQEIEQAEIQAKHALELIGSVLSKTSKQVKQDILTNTVSAELNKGMNVVNQLFINGDRNEK